MKYLNIIKNGANNIDNKVINIIEIKVKYFLLSELLGKLKISVGKPNVNITVPNSIIFL